MGVASGSVLDARVSAVRSRPGYEFARGTVWSAEALDFQQALHDTGLIFDFDWGAWHDQTERFFDDSEAVAGADEATLRRLLTLHTRQERLDEDHLLNMLHSGHVSAILRRARELGRERLTC